MSKLESENRGDGAVSRLTNIKHDTTVACVVRNPMRGMRNALVYGDARLSNPNIVVVPFPKLKPRYGICC